MFRFIALGAVALALALGGCATMDQAECRTADWHAIGYEDGSKGRASSYLSERRKDCADHGVTPDFEAYMDGRGKGIAEFCRPQNGYQLGARGYRYGGVCPAELEDAFLAAHADGYGLYQRRARVNQLSKQISYNHNRSMKIEHLIGEKTAALISPGTPPQQRLTIGIEIKQLTEERVELEHSKGQLENELARAQSDYQAYQEALARR